MKRVHLVGIGGMHMSAIAQLLLADGVTVTGSDMQDSEMTRRLSALGATVRRGHDADWVGEAELVVMTAAVTEDNPEVAEARRRGVPVIARAEMVARLMEGRIGVAVAGTHGKTTTSSLIALLLVRAGRSPAYLLGGDSLDLGGNAAPGSGPHIVVEADEYARAFLHYRPALAVITNVEADHLDYYGSEADVVEAFRQFLRRVPPDGTVIGCADSPLLAALLDEGIPAAVERYRVLDERDGAMPTAVPDDAGWVARIPSGVDATDAEGRFRFTVERRGAPFGSFETTRPGAHNIANALAAIAAGTKLGLSPEQMQAAVREFRGAHRRFEPVGEAAGVTIVDDYAHHPTEVRATLAAARGRFPGQRLVVLFQPHTYSRTAYLLDGFRRCFAAADMLYILETFAARETPAAGLSAEALAGEIAEPPARYLPSAAAAVELLAEQLHPGDVLLTVGAGDVDQVGPALLARLTARAAGR